MKNIFWTLITSILFFGLATATSPPEDDVFVLNTVDLSMEAELEDSFLLLTNTDTLRIENAAMLLLRVVNDSISGDSIGTEIFNRSGYALSSGVSDTLLFSTFKEISNQTPFPNEESPTFFRLEFFNNDGTNGVFEQTF